MRKGERILKKLKEDSYPIPLAISDKSLDSEGLTDLISQVTTYKTSFLTFIIGGSHGLAEEVLVKRDFLLSFSKFTFLHRLMRLILVEQIYRSIKIIKKEQYHK